MGVQYLSREIQLPAKPDEITSYYKTDQWAMTDAERSALSALLAKLRPQCAIEIGTYKAGSLGILDLFCNQVYTLDLDPTCRDVYGNKFPNTQFISGNSRKTLPALLNDLQQSNESLEFVLIDGDHSEEGVKYDIENILKYKPKSYLYIIMHDSFNPGCRKGIKTADWSSNPYVHLVEIDYIMGRFITKEEKDKYRQMWCGFALAIMLPERRNKSIIIHENESLMYRTAYLHSIYPYQILKKKFNFLGIRNKIKQLSAYVAQR